MTDLLIACAEKRGAEAEEFLLKIQARYKAMVRRLQVAIDIDAEFAQITEALADSSKKDYIISRGEYLNGKILAAYLGFTFIDAFGSIYLDEEGKFDEAKTREVLGGLMAEHPYAVIPGFYGTTPALSLIHILESGRPGLQQQRL